MKCDDQYRVNDLSKANSAFAIFPRMFAMFVSRLGYQSKSKGNLIATRLESIMNLTLLALLVTPEAFEKQPT